jgi:hypothetical protein
VEDPGEEAVLVLVLVPVPVLVIMAGLVAVCRLRLRAHALMVSAVTGPVEQTRLPETVDSQALRAMAGQRRDRLMNTSDQTADQEV